MNRMQVTTDANVYDSYIGLTDTVIPFSTKYTVYVGLANSEYIRRKFVHFGTEKGEIPRKGNIRRIYTELANHTYMI